MHDATKTSEVPVSTVELEKADKPAKAVRKRKTTIQKPANPTGRKPLGIKSMRAVLQVRMTPEGKEAAVAMGGSLWARKVIETALKRAVSRGEKVPRAYLKYLEKEKAAKRRRD